ncbi:MAG: hypothetical protein JNK11_03365 [Alphaproteobacteria bacterium]|nr:hypothetical protein [Alphaproteobacteria bacterium]
MRSQSLKLLAAAALVGTFAGTAVASEMVVIDSKGMPIQSGTVIDGSKPVNLSAGTALTLLGADGSPVKLAGPYAGVPAKAGKAGDASTVNALAALFQGQKKSTASLGAVRGAVASRELPDPWVVSVEDAGPRCIKEGGQVVLWRSDTKNDADIALTDGVRATKPAKWPAGQDRVAGPQGFFSGGKSYTVTVDGKPRELQMIKVPEGQTNPAALAVWMSQQGCKAQAVALLNTLK